MTLNILFAATPVRWEQYETPLREALDAAGLDAHLSQDIPPAEVDYIVYAPNSPLQDFTPYKRTKAVLNLWAGVETIVGNKTLTMPLTRMVDPGLTKGMTEWVAGHVLRHHLGMDLDILNTDAQWRFRTPPLASQRSATIFGLGALGEAVAQTLLGLGFHVSGWSRTPKDIAGVTCLSGADGFNTALASAEIAILLLPDTPATQNLFNADSFAQMPKGAILINPGRGPLIDDDALIAALDCDHLAHATLDVFRQEPLPEGHPFWAHPKITVTPHIAAETRAHTASIEIAKNIARNEAGQPLLNLVDRTRGY